MLQSKLVNLCSSNYIYIKPIKHYLCVCASLKIPPRSLFVFPSIFRPLPIINRATSRAQGQVKIHTDRQRQTTCCCCCCCSCSSGQLICKYTYRFINICMSVCICVCKYLSYLCCVLHGIGRRRTVGQLVNKARRSGNV